MRAKVGIAACRRVGKGVQKGLAAGGLCLLLAASNASASSWGQVTTIAGFYIWGNSSAAYIRTPANQNPDACTYSAYLFVDPAMPNFKETWAAVMTAYATQSTVSLYYDGCGPGGQYPKISTVAIPQVW